MQENRKGLLMLMETLLLIPTKKRTHISKCEQNVNIKGLVLLAIKQFV